MPFYEYRCERGHTFEVMQRMSDDPLSACTECGRPVQRVFHPVAVHFKGSGFYSTDYGKRKAGSAASEDGASADKGGDKSSDGAAPKKESKEKTASGSSSKSSGSDD